MVTDNIYHEMLCEVGKKIRLLTKNVIYFLLYLEPGKRDIEKKSIKSETCIIFRIFVLLAWVLLYPLDNTEETEMGNKKEETKKEERKNDFKSDSALRNCCTLGSNSRRTSRTSDNFSLQDMTEDKKIVWLYENYFLDLRTGQTFLDRRKAERRTANGRRPIRPEMRIKERRETERYFPTRENVIDGLKKYGYFTF